MDASCTRHAVRAVCRSPQTGRLPIPDGTGGAVLCPHAGHGGRGLWTDRWMTGWTTRGGRGTTGTGLWSDLWTEKLPGNRFGKLLWHPLGGNRNSALHRRRRPTRGRPRDAGGNGKPLRPVGFSEVGGVILRSGRPSNRPPMQQGRAARRAAGQPTEIGRGTVSRSAPAEQSAGERTGHVSRSAPVEQSTGQADGARGARRTVGAIRWRANAPHASRSAPAEQSAGSGRERSIGEARWPSDRLEAGIEATVSEAQPTEQSAGKRTQSGGRQRGHLSNQVSTQQAGEAPPTHARRGLRHVRGLGR